MSRKRKPLNPITRFRILQRDRFRCRDCGATSQDARLTIDHVVPRAEGGTNDPRNLVTACIECNNGKANDLTPFDAIPPNHRSLEYTARWVINNKHALSSVDMARALEQALGG